MQCFDRVENAILIGERELLRSVVSISTGDAVSSVCQEFGRGGVDASARSKDFFSVLRGSVVGWILSSVSVFAPCAYNSVNNGFFFFLRSSI